MYRARLAFDRVVAVSRVPDERIVAAPQKGGIVAGPADDHVIAMAAMNDVIAGTAVENRADAPGRQVAGVDHIVAGPPASIELIAGIGVVDDDLFR